MALDFKAFLAATVLTEGKIVSYRTLSREFKVHNNAAKKMLFEFHETQNSKKAGSVHATYLLDGMPRALVELNGRRQDGEDVHMQSSPYMSSSMPQEGNEEEGIPQSRIMLAREGDLEAAKAKFGQLNSIQIYSLGPSSVQNIQVLSDCNRIISAKYITEDPLLTGRYYGVIHNIGVKRRTGKRPAPPMPSVPDVQSSDVPGSKPQYADAQPAKPSGRPSSSDLSGKSTPQPESKPSDKEAATKPAPLKREQSDIFKSFSKPKSKLNREDTGSSAAASPAPINVQSEDTKSVQADGMDDFSLSRLLPLTKTEAMRDASEDENEGDLMGSNKPDSGSRKSRSERQEQLRRMMEDEGENHDPVEWFLAKQAKDEDMEDTTQESPQASQESEPIDGASSQKAPAPEPAVVVTGGRRRGRRKVTKKKTIKDDEGYLVTMEEPAWESFSDNEPPPAKDPTPASTVSSSMGKAKKAGGKPGQGNIMSFFGKK